MPGSLTEPALGRVEAGSTDVRAESPRPLVTRVDDTFARHYNRASFLFEHGLKGHPLFELDSLIGLSGRLPAHSDFAYWSNGRVAVTDSWEKGMAQRASLQDTIANIATNDSIVILKHTEQDPVFGPVLQRLLATFVDYAGAALRDDVVVGEALVLISSPNRITPYHFDAELNYLVQVTGDKTLNVFDHTLAKQVDDLELEGYFSGQVSSAKYGEGRQQHAAVYDLRAGHGVHIPVCAPHWVRNGDNVSVALSINYELKSVARRAEVHWLNHRLRRAGIEPLSPGVSPWRDGVKRVAARGLSGLRGLIRRDLPGPPSYAVWKPAV